MGERAAAGAEHHAASDRSPMTPAPTSAAAPNRAPDTSPAQVEGHVQLPQRSQPVVGMYAFHRSRTVRAQDEVPSDTVALRLETAEPAEPPYERVAAWEGTVTAIEDDRFFA